MVWPSMAASTALDILAAQLALAPSHMMPPTLAMVLTTVEPTWASVPPARYVTAAPAPAAAHTTPQKAERLPM